MDMEKIPIIPKVEPSDEVDISKSCFICLNETSSDHHLHRKKFSYSSVKILTCYILQNPLSCSSTSSSDTNERNNLQRNILSCLSNGNSKICSECLFKAENMMDFHLELEKIQMQILAVLRDLQDYLKTSIGGGSVGSQDDVTMSISEFQGVLLQEFIGCSFSDGAQVRLQRLRNAGYRNPSSRFYVVQDDRNELDEDSKVHLPSILNLPLSDKEGNGNLDAKMIKDVAVEGGNMHPLKSVKESNNPVPESDDDDDEWSGEDGDELSENTNDDDDDDEDIEDDLERSSDDDYDDDEDHAKSSCRSAKPSHKDPRFSQWECDICLEYFPRKDMEHHLQTHPEFEKFYECDICLDNVHKRFFGTYKGLIWHFLKRRHAVDQLPCKLCPDHDQSIKFRRTDLCKHLYEFHKLNHKKLPCKYEGCPQEFYEIYSRTNHYLREHKKKKSSGKAFTCDHCFAKFEFKERLGAHVLRVHKDGNKNAKFYNCGSCPRKFLNKSNLQIHEQSQHQENPERFKCPRCPKTFLKHALRLHIQRFHEKKMKEFQCEFCSKRFLMQSSLNTHEWRFHSSEESVRNKFQEEKGMLKCGQCSYVAKSARNLNDHKVCHREKRFLCSKCPYAGISSKYLNRHIRFRHTEKTLMCQFCSKSFGDKKTLGNHERTHTKEKPYGCKVCDMMFTSTSARNAHQRKFHGLTKKTVFAKDEVELEVK